MPCSLCGAPSVNKTSCPLNNADPTSKSYSKHLPYIKSTTIATTATANKSPSEIQLKASQPDQKLPTDSSFKSSIYKVSKQIYPEYNVKKESIDLLDEIILFSAMKIINTVPKSEKELTAQDVQTAVQKALATEAVEIMKHAISEGVKAVNKFNDSEKGYLTFSIDQVDKLIKSLGYNPSQGSSVYLTAVLEYLTAELVEVSGMEKKNKLINNDDILHAIENDLELTELYVSFLDKYLFI